MENEAKKIVRRVNAIRALIIIGYGAIAGLSAWFVGYYAMIIFLVCFFVVGRLVILMIYEKNILSLLTKRLDSALFREAVYRARLTGYYANADLCSGDYRGVVNRCVAYLRSNSKNKCMVLEYLGLCYFWLGDNEKLRTVCDAYKSTVNSGKGSVNKEVAEHMSFLEAFLDGRYEDCLEYCTYKVNKNSSQVIYNELRKGIVYYRMGEAELARSAFESVVKNAPRLGAAELAKKGIEALESGVDYSTLFEEILPDESCVSNLQKANKKHKIKRILLWIVCLILLIVGTYISSRPYDNEAEQIIAAAEEVYDDVEIIEIVHLYHDGEWTDTVGLIRTSDGIVAGEVYWYDGEEDGIFDPVITMSADLADKMPPTEFCFAVTKVSDEMITYGFSTDKGEMTELSPATLVEFSEDGNIYYFFAFFQDQFAEE